MANVAIRVLWGVSAALAALGTLLLWRSLPGVNWGIWTTLVAVGLVVVLRVGGRRVHRSVLVLAGMAMLLSWCATLTSSGVFHFLIFGTVVVLLSLAALVAAGLPVQMIGAVSIALAPVVAGALALIEVVRRKAEALGLFREGERVQVIRGLLMAVPVLAIFALLLSGADPVFDAARRELEQLLRSFSFVDDLIIFGGLGAATLGGFGVALRGGHEGRLDSILSAPRPVFGVTERAIVLGSVAALFAVFLLLQLAYLFGDLGGARGSGVTYAEYARRGFGELTTAVTLCTGMLIALALWRSPGKGERLVQVLSLALIVELHLLLVSALRRVHLYEAAYGYTTDRLYAQVYMAAVSAALLLLAWELWVGLEVRRLARRVALAGFVALLGLTVWNHEGWIATRNIDRALVTGKLDAAYLGTSLSLDAAPAAVAGLSRLDAPLREELRAALHRGHYDPDALAARRWWEWNPQREAGIEALSSAGITITERPADPPH